MLELAMTRSRSKQNAEHRRDDWTCDAGGLVTHGAIAQQASNFVGDGAAHASGESATAMPSAGRCGIGSSDSSPGVTGNRSRSS